MGSDIAGINKNGSTAYNANSSSHERKHIIKGINIADVRDVFKKARAARKDCCGNNCNSGIFCAADLDLSAKRGTAFDYEFIQCSIPLKCIYRNS